MSFSWNARDRSSNQGSNQFFDHGGASKRKISPVSLLTGALFLIQISNEFVPMILLNSLLFHHYHLFQSAISLLQIYKYRNIGVLLTFTLWWHFLHFFPFCTSFPPHHSEQPYSHSLFSLYHILPQHLWSSSSSPYSFTGRGSLFAGLLESPDFRGFMLFATKN